MHDKHQEPAATSARDLARKRTMGKRNGAQAIDVLVGDACGGAFFRRPRIIENPRHCFNVANKQCALHLDRVGLEPVYRLDGGAAVTDQMCSLLFDDLGRIPRAAGEADDQRGFELVSCILGDPQRVDDYPVVCEKFNEIRSAEGRSILVLLAAGKTEIDPFDLKGEMGDIVLTQRDPQPSPERIDEATVSAEDEPSPEPAGASTVVVIVAAIGRPSL